MTVLGTLVCLHAVSVHAQSSNEDLLKQIETQAPAEKSEEPKLYELLRKNSDFKLYVRSMSQYQRATDRANLDSRSFFIEGAFHYQTTLTFDKNVFNLKGWFEYGNQKDTYQGGTEFIFDRDRHRNIAELNEINWAYRGDAFDATLGRKVFKLGTATALYAPSDRVTPKEMNDPLNPKELGVWLVSLDAYKDATSATVALFPFFNPTKFPSETSRWAGTGYPQSVALPPFFGLSSLGRSVGVTNEYPGFAWQNLQGLVRIKTTVAGWDFFAASFHGFNFFPVLKLIETLDTTLVPLPRTEAAREYVKVGNHSAGFSTTYWKLEFHGEGFYQYAYANKDDHYFAYDGGVTYTIDDFAKQVFLDQIDWTVDYAGEEITKRQDRASYTISSEKARPARNNLMTRVLLKYDEKLRFALLANLDFLDGGKMYFAGFEYKIRKGLLAKLHSEWFWGNSSSYYGQWRENNRFVTTLEYSL